MPINGLYILLIFQLSRSQPSPQSRSLFNMVFNAFLMTGNGPKTYVGTVPVTWFDEVLMRNKGTNPPFMSRSPYLLRSSKNLCKSLPNLVSVDLPFPGILFWKT